MPSIKEDGFVWHAKDYCNKVTAELNSIHFPGNYFQNYANEWKDIDKSLLDDDDFGHRMKKSNPFKNEMTAAKIYNLKRQYRKDCRNISIVEKEVEMEW